MKARVRNQPMECVLVYRTVFSTRIVAFAAFASLGLALVCGPAFVHDALGAKPSSTPSSTKLLPVRDLGFSRPHEQHSDRGTTPSIELNVDGLDEGENASLFTFGGDQAFKAGFGNRFTLTPEQTPFALKQASGLFAETMDNVGFEAGQSVGITILVDATSSADINDAVPVLNGTFTLSALGLITIDLPSPVIVQQGDIYIIFTDLNSDDEKTTIPILLLENGGIGDGRAFATITTGTPDSTDPSGYLRLAELATPILGNCVVRGLGDPALPADQVTGGGEPFDTGLPTPTDLSAFGTSSVTLAWTPPVLPPPPAPLALSESEPNDGPATAQNVGPNAVVTGSASSNDGGSPGGFGTDDVEDWFAFTLTEATSVDIDLTGFGGVDFDLLLYDAAGPFTTNDVVALSGGPAGEEEHISVAVLPPGAYRVAVTAYDPDVPAVTNYSLSIVAAKKVNRYNVYRGGSPDFAPSAATFFASLPGSDTTFTVVEGGPGAYYRITAVVVTAQTTGSNPANTGPDTSPPQLACPSQVVVPAAPAQCSAQANYSVPAVSDNQPGATVACVPVSGSTLSVGTTPVDCVATDVAGNTSQCSFALVVADTQAPGLACHPNVQTVALTLNGRVVSYTLPTATDNCGAGVMCAPAPGATFAIGTTTVTCTATDGAGNQTSCQFTVSVGPLGTDTAGVFVSSTGSWFLRNANSPGAADLVFGYGPAGLGWLPLEGDWDGNGTDTAGLYDPVNGNFFLKNTNAGGGADLVYGFGPAGLGWRPLVGDWNGDGVDTIGLYDPVNGNFFLRNAHAPGAADVVYGFGPAGLGWVPIVGDWDGNGTDTVGLYAPSAGNFFLKNAHSAGGADLVYGFGPAGLGWRPLAGDWNGNGADSVGHYSPSDGFFFLKNMHSPGPADIVFGYGPANTTPILGDWNGM